MHFQRNTQVCGWESERRGDQGEMANGQNGETDNGSSQAVSQEVLPGLTTGQEVLLELT